MSGLREEAFDGEHGLDVAIVRSSASSQEHLTKSRAKKKNKSRQQHRASTKSQHRCSRNLSIKVTWERLSSTMCTACLFSGSLQRRPEPVFEPRSNLASTFPAEERRSYGLSTSWVSATSSLRWTSWATRLQAPCPRKSSMTTSDRLRACGCARR